MGEEKDIARGQLIKEEELLISAELAMIPLCGFFEEFFMIRHLLLVWESYAIYPLQGIIVLVTSEVT